MDPVVPSPEDARDETQSVVPAGAAAVVVDGEELSDAEKLVLTANQPGPNYFPETEQVEAEAVVATRKVVLVDDSPVDAVYVNAPGIDPEADWATADSEEYVDGNGEKVEHEVHRVKVTSSPVELPALVAESVASSPLVKVTA